MVMVNTKAHASVTDCSDPLNPKYYMVIVQASSLGEWKLSWCLPRNLNGDVGRSTVVETLAARIGQSALQFSPYQATHC